MGAAQTEAQKSRVWGWTGRAFRRALSLGSCGELRARRVGRAGLPRLRFGLLRGVRLRHVRALLARRLQCAASNNSTLRHPFVWERGVLNGYSSTRVSLWGLLMFGRLAMGLANVRAGTRVLMLVLVQALM